MSRLKQVDLGATLDRTAFELRLPIVQQRLMQLRLTYAGLLEGEAEGPGVLVLLEGWDAAGKGGAIKHLVMPLDPRHVHVAQFSAPTPAEVKHHYLWRFMDHLPPRGGMSVFDRSWYGRVLVERVEELTPEPAWHRAFDEICAFERILAADGMVVVKVFLHISPEEQLRRFEKRSRDPLKKWKLTPDDWRNRGLRPVYERAVEDMLDRCSQPEAPWHVVPGESKRYARISVLEVVVGAMEDGLRRSGREVPPPLV